MIMAIPFRSKCKPGIPQLINIILLAFTVYCLYQINQIRTRWGSIPKAQLVNTTVLQRFRMLFSQSALATGKESKNLNPPYYVVTDKVDMAGDREERREFLRHLDEGVLTEIEASSQSKVPTIVQSDSSSTYARITGVKVLTCKRPDSLLRLLKSLEAADYDGDTLSLDIWIDGLPENINDRAKIKEAYDKTVQVSEAFVWSHGEKTVHKREKQMSVVGQWLGCFIPRHDLQVSVIFEDDIEASPFYYKWIKAAYLRYRDVYTEKMAAITTQRATLVAKSVKGQKFEAPEDGTPFLYKLVGSWGLAPIGKHWAAFLKWYKNHERENLKLDNPALRFHPYVDNLITTSWYKTFEKENRTQTMWTQWFIRYCEEKALYTLYSNPPQNVAFSANWREKGEHYVGNAPSKTNNLLNQETQFKQIIDNFPGKLTKVDWDGQLVQ